jgi:hypothetical protein
MSTIWQKIPTMIDWIEMNLLSVASSVWLKKATSLLNARNSKMICRKETTMVAASRYLPNNQRASEQPRHRHNLSLHSARSLGSLSPRSGPQR